MEIIFSIMTTRITIGHSVLASLLLLSILSYNCTDPDVAEAPQPMPISNVVIADPEFGLFEEAVALANLGNTLSGAGPFTVLIPNDDAFTASGINSATIAALTPVDAQALVNYHTITGSTSFANFPGGPNAKIITVSGDSIFVTKNANGVFVNGWKITEPDLSASNGLIHKIEHVLVPPRGNIIETAQLATGVLDSFAKAVQRAINGPGGDPTLATWLGSTTLTVFAPSNQAFSDYLSSLSLTDINNIPMATLLAVLRYHIVAGRTFSSGLLNGNLTMVTAGTTLVNLTNGISGGPTITGTGNAGNSSNIITANIVARNGVIHVIDRVLIP
jgi:uncharacterized surface protein with fasciclin (FAS1) repeats